MKRRSYLTAMLAAVGGMKELRAQQPAKNPIVLYCDLTVDPAREQEMLNNFHTIFKPAAEKIPGLHRREAPETAYGLHRRRAAAGVNYRFQLTYESEELRQKWIKSAVHQKVWPTVENTLEHEELFDAAFRFEITEYGARKLRNMTMKRYFVAACVGFSGLVLLPITAREPLAARIVHTDASKFRKSPAVHGGPGYLDFTALFDAHAVEPNLQFLHRGVIEPKSGIGAHFHNRCEEMFVILDGEAQFTIDGRTSVLKGPAGAPCRLGHSHAIYNATDKPVQWMNINVSLDKGPV